MQPQSNEAKKQVKDARKQRKDTVGWTNDTLEASAEYLVHCEWSVVNRHHQMNRQSFLDVSDELPDEKLRRQKRRMNWRSIGSIVILSYDQFKTRQRHTKTYSVEPDESTPWSVEALVYLMVSRKLTESFRLWSLQHWMNRRTVG
jgi:hypothetical protein